MNAFIPDFSHTRVIVLGDVMLDKYVWGSVSRISPEAPIPVVHVRDRTSRLGGAGNVAANLSGLGCQTILIGILGQDQTGTQLAELIRNQGIENACLVSPCVPTVTKTRIMGGAQQVVRLDDEQPDRVDAALREQGFEKLKERIHQTDTLIVSDYGKGLLDDRLIKKCMALCREHGVSVFVDPKRKDWHPYAGASCVTPNRREFELACKQFPQSPALMDKAALALVEHYHLQHLLVTMGNEGMILWDSHGKKVSIPSKAKEVFDVSGAGDTVIALLAAGHAAGLPMVQAMELANLGAGEVVGRVGTYALSLDDLELAALTGKGGSTAACTLTQALNLTTHWRMQGQTIVFTNGCFDILHPGHVSLLRRAKQIGRRLIVGLNTDASIKRIKGPFRPILSQQDRAAIVSALDCVDAVVFFGDDTPIQLIKALRPDVLVKGGDYTPDSVVGAELMPAWGGRVEILELAGENSTTAIVEKIRNGGKSKGKGFSLA